MNQLLASPKIDRTEQLTVTVRLSDFKPEDVVAYLRNIGYRVDGQFSPQLLRALKDRTAVRLTRLYRNSDEYEEEEGLFLNEEDMHKALTLLLCGQRQDAREYILDLVSDYLGRKL